MIDPRLIPFIKDTKGKGYDDWQIREALLKYGWGSDEVESAFSKIYSEKENAANKGLITISIGHEILQKLEKRAKRNLLSLHEQIEDILRRSCLNLGSSATSEKLDDKFIGYFSRKD